MKQLIRCAAAALLVLAAHGAQAQVVVVVNAKSAVTSLSAEQVANVYLGRSTDYTPFDHAEGATIRNDFYARVTGKDAAQIKAVWSKLVFTGKGTPPKELPGSAEVKKAVAARDNGIGYIEKSAVDSTVKVVLTVQ